MGEKAVNESGRAGVKTERQQKRWMTAVFPSPQIVVWFGFMLLSMRYKKAVCLQLHRRIFALLTKMKQNFCDHSDHKKQSKVKATNAIFLINHISCILYNKTKRRTAERVAKYNSRLLTFHKSSQVTFDKTSGTNDGRLEACLPVERSPLSASTINIAIFWPSHPSERRQIQKIAVFGAQNALTIHLKI